MSSGASVADADAQILIVDDNVDAAMSLVMLLDLEDMTAVTVADAPSALALIGAACPPLMLIDIGLPGMNGFELAKRLRAHPVARYSTLIALTGREPRDVDDPDARLFDRFWTKPFDPNKLLADVKAILSAFDSATQLGDLNRRA